MPVLPLKPFFAYKQNEFRIGGNPAEVFDFARRWRTFADNALTTAASLRTINDGGFLGSEGDRYRELVHGEFPQHLTITGESHGGVSTAVTQYAEALVSAQTQMNALLAVAVVDHTMVQTAVARYNVCEANLVRAAATAKMATATAIATAAVPGVNAATASAATAAQSDLAAAQAAFEAAKAEHLRATTTFDADVAKGASIKTALSTEVQTVVTMIRSQARKRFEENPNWLQAGWNDRQNWMRKESDDMGILTQILEGIGSMLTAIIEFDEKVAREIMIPRTKVFLIDKNISVDELFEKKEVEVYSRIPVYENEADNIVGILFMKDLMIEAYRKGFQNVKLPEIMQEAYFVPETKNVNELFNEMQSEKKHIAILIDEYGGFSGIVTLEDLIEEVMGNISDEFDADDSSIKKLSANKYLVNGELSLNDLNDYFHIELESKHYDTLSGLLIEHMGYIPEDDEDIEPIIIDEISFKPKRVKDKKIEWVLAKFNKEEKLN